MVQRDLDCTIRSQQIPQESLQFTVPQHDVQVLSRLRYGCLSSSVRTASRHSGQMLLVTLASVLT
jgi:hypothetical protein